MRPPVDAEEPIAPVLLRVLHVLDAWTDSLFERFDADGSGAMNDAEWESMARVAKEEAEKNGV